MAWDGYRSDAADVSSESMSTKSFLIGTFTSCCGVALALVKSNFAGMRTKPRRDCKLNAY